MEVKGDNGEPDQDESCKNIPDYFYAFQPHLVAPTKGVECTPKTMS